MKLLTTVLLLQVRIPCFCFFILNFGGPNIFLYIFLQIVRRLSFKSNHLIFKDNHMHIKNHVYRKTKSVLGVIQIIRDTRRGGGHRNSTHTFFAF
jgi:hypothetical protein